MDMTTVFRLREVLGQREEPLSLLQLAKRAGLSYGTIHAIYRNKTTRVDLASLDAIAGVLRCEPGELIARRKRG